MVQEVGVQVKFQWRPKWSSIPAVQLSRFLKELTMKYASAYYCSEPSVEIYVFVDEEPSGLPDGATEICKSESVDEFLSLIEPYFILAKDK